MEASEADVLLIASFMCFNLSANPTSMRAKSVWNPPRPASKSSMRSLLVVQS